MSEQKIEAFWRDATADDIAKVMRGEKVKARFRDYKLQDWHSGPCLNGWRIKFDGNKKWYDSEDVSWMLCQVYEPQQWWLDKPDPGEGWRLLEKFPPEGLQPGDEWFEPDPFETGWKVSHNERQAETIWYRRRIEPVNSPEKLDSSPCVGFPKGWTALSLDEPRLASDAYWSQDAEAWVIISDGWVEAANREKWPAIRFKNHFLSLVSIPGSFEWVTQVGDIVRHPNGKRYRVQKAGWEYVSG
jgi:hypothetical protein